MREISLLKSVQDVLYGGWMLGDTCSHVVGFYIMARHHGLLIITWTSNTIYSRRDKTRTVPAFEAHGKDRRKGCFQVLPVFRYHLWF